MNKLTKPQLKLLRELHQHNEEFGVGLYTVNYYPPGIRLRELGYAKYKTLHSSQLHITESGKQYLCDLATWNAKPA